MTSNTVLVSGSSLSDKVKQTPAHMFKKSTETVNISCSHSIDNYDRILWYKQLNNRQLQFLGYMLANIENPESGVAVKMEGNANKDQTCTLTIKTLDLNSSAVYFCAASLHSATHHCSSVQKPHHHYVFISS
ncbi:immunoglobulin lambda-1 light chain-like [Solea senegalensis]|nr:immunoglobulin lambda-1 light chain-like [Solea senegalensis]